MKKCRGFILVGIVTIMFSCSEIHFPTLESNSHSTVSLCRNDSLKLSTLDDVMMQAFYWDVSVDEVTKNGSWWNELKQNASELKSLGFSAIWTPCPSKGNWGIVDNGYGIYDHYDLGNYNQKGTIEIRFGSR